MLAFSDLISFGGIVYGLVMTYTLWKVYRTYNEIHASEEFWALENVLLEEARGIPEPKNFFVYLAYKLPISRFLPMPELKNPDTKALWIKKYKWENWFHLLLIGWFCAGIIYLLMTGALQKTFFQ